MLTQILKRMEPRRPRMVVLVGLVLGMLLTTVAVTWQAHRGDRAREEQAARFLGRTATLAAGDWSDLAETALFNSLRATFAGIADRVESGHWPEPHEVLESVLLDGLCDCLEAGEIDFAFTLDLRRAEGRATEPGHEPKLRALAHRIRGGGAPVAILTPTRAFGLAAAVDSAGEPLVFAWLLRLENDEPVGAFGFAARPIMLDWFLDNAFALPLLPPELLHAGRNDSTFVLTVVDSRGRTFYRSAEPLAEAAFEGTLPLDRLLAGFEARIQVRPAAAGTIVGGPYRARSGPLLILLFFTTGVAAFALYLIRRETELARLRENFVAGVSHELRTPLAQIRMFAETLRLGRVRSPAERRRSLEIIDQESRRLAHLVENVLQFARSGRGTIRLRLEAADMANDVRDAVHAFGVLHNSPDVEVRTELQEGITATVDRDLLRQILVNLLDNATKYGPLTQRITVGLALVGNRARVWVDDEGPGIPAEERERVFDAFYRLPRESASAVGGSGIGLAIVRELARAHGGSCRIEEAPGGGARVIVEFPDAQLRPGAGAAVA